MAKAYLLCLSDKFNESDFEISFQYDLLEDLVEGEPETYIKSYRKEFHLGFNQYKCHHDYKHNKSGRVFQQDFTYYFEPLDFYTYYCTDTNLTMIQTKTDVAIDFIQKLNETKEYDINPIEIDFEKMIPHITEIGGAWFANLKKAHLKSAGLFGPHVNKSEEYKEAAKEGNISSIQINFISGTNSKEYTVLISSRGTIVLYDTHETIEAEMELVKDIYNKLIKPHL